ncbi:hypothetical protein GGTG_06602 [Gaeumannomyces tritici R3-111a-1]|uniref:Uncharacterized protein n=1 Tax=Gaeumannomyces tritici (strain R3-111a-1) TaxID=644352 RepID=J3NZA3_GAET3|nr:hypothetical protein GGTG_06602 [Gaeumannomyces tritici R3-111a-1]EJT76686.1 hypothetical protein GGTG_06602 [Gaeumannomyces tritici R3-111a-1]
MARCIVAPVAKIGFGHVLCIASRTGFAKTALGYEIKSANAVAWGHDRFVAELGDHGVSHGSNADANSSVVYSIPLPTTRRSRGSFRDLQVLLEVSKNGERGAFRESNHPRVVAMSTRDCRSSRPSRMNSKSLAWRYRDPGVLFEVVDKFDQVNDMPQLDSMNSENGIKLVRSIFGRVTQYNDERLTANVPVASRHILNHRRIGDRDLIAVDVRVPGSIGGGVVLVEQYLV